MKLFLKGLKMILIILAALLLLVWGGLNIAKYAIYPDYYTIKTNVCKNPGVHDGFICQGISADEASGKFLISGYMKDHSASRIYITDHDSNSYHVSLTTGGKPYTGHAGGIAVHGDSVYLANAGKLYLFPLSDLMGVKNGDVVEIGEGIPVNNKASFCFADDDFVYVGEFHDGGAYIAHHPYETPDGTYNAIVARYAHDHLEAPECVYAIRNKVQGICTTDDGRIVLSTSYVLSDSVYYVYNEAEAIDSGLTLDGAPVFYLTECIREFKGPAMAEGLDFTNGKVITLTESASDKYIFGKFFFADKIVALAL